MKQTITSHKFHCAFEELRTEQFSYEALHLLFDYFESIEEDGGEEIELDVIAICCEYSESSVQYIISDYSIDVSDCDGEDEIKEAVIQYLAEHTRYLGYTDIGLVYQQF